MTAPKSTTDSRKSMLRLLPAGLFLALVAMFAVALRSGDPSKLPSTLIGKPAPATVLAGIDGLMVDGKAVAGLDPALLATGKPVIVNFWASWCAPCVAEHPLLTRVAQQTGAALIGINHKDQANNAKRFLGLYGNPFAAIGVDRDGRAAIEWGVYGMPETFVVDGRGRIVYKHVGPLSEDSVARQVVPAIERAALAP